MKTRNNPYLKLHFLAAIMVVGSSTPTVLAGTTWDAGGGTTTNINTASNWDGDVVNALNGTTSATFGTAGSTATINTNASFTGITFNRDAAFTIADGSGSLTVGSNGITVTLPTTTGRTHIISESSLVLGSSQTWSITNNSGGARLDVNSVVSGASASITKTGNGTLAFGGGNTFGGGLNVHEGSLLAQSNASALGGGGTGAVFLGNTTGSANASLLMAQSLVFSNPITVQAGNSGTMTINNNGFASPTLAGTITLDKALTLNNNDTSAPFGNPTVSGKITGGSGLTISASNAAGPITLSNAANDYIGTTAVNSGILRLTGNLENTAVTVASGASLAGEGSIGAAASLTFNAGSTLRVDGTTATALTVNGNLTLTALTNVILDPVPAVPGIGTTIRLLNYNGTFGGSASDLNPINYRNAVVSTGTPNQIDMTLDTKSLIWSGASVDWDINTSFNWDGGAEKFYQADAVTFNDSGTTKAVALAVSVVPASVLFDNTTGNDYILAGAGAISGATALTKSNTGTVTLSTPNTYSGGTTISGGKIIATVANALGTGSVTNNATLDLTAGAVTYTGLSTGMSGNGTVNLTLPTGSNTATLNGDYSGFTGTWNIGDGVTGGKASMNGLDNASSMINVLSNGTVSVSGAVTKNATLTLNGGNTGESLGQLRLDSGATWAGDVILAGDITSTADFTFGSNGGGGTISGDISETGTPRALSKGGPSTIVISGANSYTGATSTSNGILKLGSAGALGGATVKTSGLTVIGGTLDLFGQTPTAVVPLTLNSTTSTSDVGSLYNTSATTATWPGTVTLGATTVHVGSGNIELTGAITGASKNINKNGLGTLSLTNSGTGVGAVTLGTLQANRGTIQVGSGTTLNVTSIIVGSGNSVGSGLTLDGGDVTASGTASFGTATSGTASATLTLNSGTLTVPALTKGPRTFNVTFNGGTLKASAATTAFFDAATSAKVQAGGAFIHDGGNAITIAQPLIHDTALGVTPDGGLSKAGAGTLTLSGLNTYTGDTTVTDGTLVISTDDVLSDESTVRIPNLGSLSLTHSGTDQVKALFVGGLPQADGLYAFGSGSLLVQSLTPFQLWAADKELDGTAGKENGPADDPDNDGSNNLAEFAFNGDPLSGSDNGKVFVLTADTDADSTKELILTIAVRSGAPAFTGTPSPSAVINGITYTVRGSTDLSTFTTQVNVVATQDAGLPPAGDGYEYRSFSLEGSDGLAGKGFLRVMVTN